MSYEVRPWGCFEVLAEHAGYKVKRITVANGGRLSLQSHRHRSEHWTVVSGIATVTVDERIAKLGPQQSIDIPCGAKHRLESLDGGPAVVVEVQFGDYLGEDDIIRYDDIYGR